MIVTDRFVFLHLHKSGGSFVNRFLLETIPGARQVGYHLPSSCIPPEARRLPVLGTVRNPWDYYVSWYSFQQAMPSPNALFAIASGERRLGFAGTLRNLMRLGEDAELLDAWAARLPRELPNRGINLSRACVAPLRNSGMGLYSFLYQRMYGDPSQATLLDMGRLREDLLPFLERVGTSVTPAMRSWLGDTPPVNTSIHDRYDAYYDDSSRQLVADKDAGIIRRHGFVFEAAKA
jgi:hypothetical protein